MDRGGRSTSRLRDRLARMFHPGTLLRSTCNTAASTCPSSTALPAGAGASTATTTRPPPRSTCSSSRALLVSSRRDYAAVVARTESFSTAVDRLHHRAAGVAPAPPSRFSVNAPSPLLERNKKKEKSPRHRLGGGASRNDKAAKLKLLSNDPYGFSTSDDDTDVFSSDAEDLDGGANIKKLVGESAERFFSSDSSEFYTTKKKKKKKKKKNNKGNKRKSPAPPSPPPKPPTKEQRRHRRAVSSCDTCGVRDGFRPVVSAAGEQLRKGFAVVKRSRDPYADFQSSMVEMIVGRQLFGAPELERLLRSYLSLNAARHHPVILQAFSDIWPSGSSSTAAS